MKLWIDDVRPAPDGYVWCTTVNQVKMLLQDPDVYDKIRGCQTWTMMQVAMQFGGGDYIKVLDFIEQTAETILSESIV